MPPYYTDASSACSKRGTHSRTERLLARPLPLWLLRVVWATLPLTAGPAASAALGEWSSAPRVVRGGPAAGRVGRRTPGDVRAAPATVTGLRVVAPAFVITVILAAIGGAPSAAASVTAVVATLVGSVLASGHDVSIASANATSYGDELRFPLRVPPALFLAPLPLARLLVAAACVAGPLLLADGKMVLGVVALLVGAPLVFVLSPGRSFGLARRWAVLVPAGFVVVDPFTLTDPHLFLREHVRWMAQVTRRGGPRRGCRPPARRHHRIGGGALRLGRRPVPPLPTRRETGTVAAEEICIAVVRPAEMLRLAAQRRLPVRA